MGLFHRDNEPQNAEEYRKRAKEYQEKGKDMRHTFYKTGVFFAAALSAILILSVAWFVTNTFVRGTGASISAKDGRKFYLATRKTDSQGIYDHNTIENSVLADALKAFDRIDKDIQSFQELPQFTVGMTEVTGTDGNKYIVGDSDGISLMVNSVSNVNNNVKNGYVGPGARGEITFYIIPTVDNLKQVNITVSMAAYKLVISDNIARAELIDGSSENLLLRKILCGHMLLFKGKDSNGDYVDHISPKMESDGTISFSFTENGNNWSTNQPVEITLYWIWPHRFENLVFSGQRESVFKTTSEAQNNLITWINNNKEWIVNQTEEQSITGEAGTGMTNLALSQWSAGYNKGDQLIGDTVSYFIWTISAEEDLYSRLTI